MAKYDYNTLHDDITINNQPLKQYIQAGGQDSGETLVLGGRNRGRRVDDLLLLEGLIS